VRGILLIAVVTLGACGGGATPAASSPAASSPAAASASQSPAAAPTPSATSSAARQASLVDIISQGKNATYRISYRFTTTTGGVAQSVDQTTYVKGTKVRWDMDASGTKISMFVLEDGTYMCTSGAGAVCLKYSGAAQAPMQNAGASFQDQVRASPGQFSAAAQSARTIAGVSAQCFTLTGAALAGAGAATTCYSADGLPLYTELKGGAQGDFTMEATSLSTSVSDADFTLPAPVRSLP
jgi:hypothetical protein